MTAEPAAPTHRIAFANALRGVAALAVVLAHYCGVFWYSRSVVAQFIGASPLPSTIPTPPAVIAFNTQIAPVVSGPFGVALFFLISGFVIPFSFNRKTRLQFLAGRVLRLWPTYFCGFVLSIAIAGLCLTLQHPAVPFSMRHVMFHAVLGLREITGLPSMDGVIWTLESELRFYLFAAILGPVLLSRRAPFVYVVPFLLCIFAIGAQRLSLTLLRPYLGWARHEAFYYPYVIYMFIGVSLNAYYRGVQTRTITALSVAVLLPAAGVALGSSDFALYVAPSYLSALLVFLSSMAVPKNFWSARPFRFMAAISFPLYTVHALTGFAILNVLLVEGFSPGMASAVAFAVAITLAWTLHVMVEVPTHRMDKRIASGALP